MKPYVFRLLIATLFAGSLLWACKKDNEAPATPVPVPKWDVYQARTLYYDILFEGYTEGKLAKTRSTTLRLIFPGDGTVTAIFDDAAFKTAFKMDSTGTLTPVDPDQLYSPILDLLSVIPPAGLPGAELGSQWEVLIPAESKVSSNPEVFTVQSRRNFKVLSATDTTLRLEQNGFLRLVDNKAAKRNLDDFFGPVAGALARADWTSWRRFLTGTSEFSTAGGNLRSAEFVAVILPDPNLTDAQLIASPEREELTIRIRP